MTEPLVLSEAVRLAQLGAWAVASTKALDVAELARRHGDREVESLALALNAAWVVHVCADDMPRTFALARLRVSESPRPLPEAMLAVAFFTSLAWRGRLREAKAAATRTRALWERSLTSARRARAWGHLAVVHFILDELDHAERLARCSARAADAVLDVRWRVLSRALLAWIAAERGQHTQTARYLREATSIAQAEPDPVAEAIVDFVRGEIAFRASRFEEALAPCARAGAALHTSVPVFAALAWMALATSLAELGRIDDADAAALRGAQLTPILSRPVRALIELRTTQIAIVRGTLGARQRALVQARASSAEPMLRGGVQALLASLERHSTRLRIGPRAAWFEIAGVRSSLERAPTARRLLGVFARHAPERLPTCTVLEEMGWEARTELEHVRATARLHQAIRRLRRAGLGALLDTDGERIGLRFDVYLDQDGEAPG